MRAEEDIGFGKKIKLSWLVRAYDLAASNVDFKDARLELVELIKLDNPGDAAVLKILSSVKRVWFTPPAYSRDLHEEGSILAESSLSNVDRLAIHFGKVALSYPFVGVTAETCGRLLRIQGSFRTQEVVRRIQERFGDRGFTRRCARYNVSSFLDWGLLNIEDGMRYSRAKPIQIRNERIVCWLVAVIMRTLVKRDLGLSEIGNHPALFPFSIPEITPRLLSSSKHVVIKRIALNQEVVSLESVV